MREHLSIQTRDVLSITFIKKRRVQSAHFFWKYFRAYEKNQGKSPDFSEKHLILSRNGKQKDPALAV